MDFFPIVALIIATFLLLIGIVGRGASMGASQFHITLEGSIGRLPRVAILTASIVTYLLAIFLFVYAAESKSGSETPPAQTVAVMPISGETEQSTMTVTIESEMPDDAIAETDTIVIEDSDPPLSLEMDTETVNANGTFYIDEGLSDTYVNYRVDITLTYADESEKTFSGEGQVIAADGLAYRVDFGDDGSAVLEPA